MSDDKPLRDQLLALLRGGNAHAGFDATVADLAPEHRGVRPEGTPHSAWQLLEHLRIAQRDILEFSRDPQHVSPKWPDGYWPKDPAPPGETAWDESVAAFSRDNQALQDRVADPKNDLHAPLPWGDGQTLLREALLAADHNAYHLGQLILVRRLLGAWKEE
jgi:hypothetical protein